MIRAELRGLLSRKLRTILTLIAIVLGVSMISGTYVLTDTINQAFDQIFQQATRNIDAVVVGKSPVRSTFTNPPPVPGRVLNLVRNTEDVQAADGEIADEANLFTLSKKGLPKSVSGVGGAPSLLFGIGDQSFNQLSLVDGHWPTGREIAVDEATMNRSHLRLGEVIDVSTAEKKLTRFRISGETKFGNVGSIGGATLVEMALPQAQRMTNKVGKYDQISVRAVHGVSQQKLVARIREEIPVGLQSKVAVRSGEKQAKTQENQIANALKFLKIGLLAFGGIAVFVGAFIIFNTFSITVAQRRREFALLRTLGATRSQILWTVVSEALLVGFIAAVAGLVAGLGIAKALNGLFNLLQIDLPSAGLVVATRTVIVAILVGTVVTLGAGLIPALVATRVPPIAAMREGVALPRGRLAKLTPYIAALVVIVGLAITLFGLFGSFSQATPRLEVIGLGAFLLFLGVAMITPQLVRPLAAVLGWPMQQFTSITGRLARDNGARNPSRTAVTAAALMIGLALVAFVTIFAAELRKTADDIVSRDVAGTFIVENANNGSNTIQPSAVALVSRIPGVALTSVIQSDVARVAHAGRTTFSSIQPTTINRVYRFQWKSGSPETSRTLAPRDVLIDDGQASSHHWHVGSTIHIVTSAGIHDSLTVTGIYKSSILISGAMVAHGTFVRDWQQVNSQVLVVNADPHVNQAKLQRRLTTKLARAYPELTASSQAQFKAQADRNVNQLLGLIYVLLGLSIVVSLFGIINTLVLSIYERTREIGMLRAIGMTRTQVRWMVRWESVITALIGAILGLGLGILLAMLITSALQSQGIEYALPLGQLLLWLLFALVFGIVAAAFPARRAARLDVLKAVAYE